jgi:LacI family transcriptional regulator
LPAILVNRSEARDRVSSVVSDDDMGMRLAVDHLVGLSHRRIAHVAGPLSTSTGTLRRDGFERAMSRHGLNGMIREATATPARLVRRPAADLLNAMRDITAVVAANDLLALGVVDALKEQGCGVRRTSHSSATMTCH